MRRGTATGRRCIPMRVSPMSSPRLGLHPLHRHRVGETPGIGRSGKGAPRLGLGDGVDHLQAGGRVAALLLHDEGAVEVLAALGRQVEVVGLGEHIGKMPSKRAVGHLGAWQKEPIGVPGRPRWRSSPPPQSGPFAALRPPPVPLSRPGLGFYIRQHAFHFL